MQSIVIALCLTVSFTVMIGCVWQQLRSRLFRSKSLSSDKNANKNDSDIENMAKDKDSNKELKTDSKTDSKTNSIDRESHILTVVNDKEHESNDPLTSFDEAMNACLKAAESLETLEHINKSRPKRSNIRRSTRKSKQSLEIDLSTDNIINNNDKCETISMDDNVMDHNQLKEQISSTLSMFSARIEEVTRPLSPLTPTRQEVFEFDAKQSNESLPQLTPQNEENVVKPEISLIDRTKRIGSPLLNSAIFAELKLKQTNRFNKLDNNSKISDKISNNQISDCIEKTSETTTDLS